MSDGSGSKPPNRAPAGAPRQPSASPWQQPPSAGQPARPVQQPMAQPGQPVQQPMAQPGQPMQQPMAQPGQPMQQPMAQPGQPMVPAQPAAPAQPGAQPNDAFGFQPENKDEKYNTLYLTSHLNQDRKRNQMIIVGVVVAALAGALMWLGMMPDAKKAPETKKPGNTAVAPTTKKPADDAKKAATPASDAKKEAADDSKEKADK